MEENSNFKEFAERAVRVLHSDVLSWQDKWNIVFKDEDSLKDKIDDLEIEIDYKIEGDSHEEEVKSFLKPVERKYRQEYSIWK